MNTQEQAYINGFVKRANEHGLDQNEALALLKTAVSSEDLEKAKMSPGIAGALGILPGFSEVYGSLKDMHNTDINPVYEQLKNIDKYKLWSKARADHHADNSASGLINSNKLPGMLKGLGIGALTGMAAGGISEAMTPEADIHSILENSLLPGAIGSLAGTLGGSAYGAYQGAKNYNELLDNLATKPKK
jgi:hypothetical protein